MPLPVSTQNEFSLLHAKDWPYLIEMCELGDIALRFRGRFGSNGYVKW